MIALCLVGCSWPLVIVMGPHRRRQIARNPRGIEVCCKSQCSCVYRWYSSGWRTFKVIPSQRNGKHWQYSHGHNLPHPFADRWIRGASFINRFQSFTLNPSHQRLPKVKCTSFDTGFRKYVTDGVNGCKLEVDDEGLHPSNVAECCYQSSA